MQKIRWGIIGCGNVTEMKSGPAFNKVPNSELVAIMRRDEIKLRDYALRHQVPLTFTSGTDLIHCDQVDAIYIATPPSVREKYAMEAMEAGKPVYLEKPMALNVAACNRLKNTSEQLGVKLSVAHYRRNLPLFKEVKKLLDQKSIGEVLSVNITMLKYAGENTKDPNNWRLNPTIAGGGYFYDLAPHQIDLLLYFFGKAASYKGQSFNKAGLYKVEDLVEGEMMFQGAIPFKGIWNFCVDKGLEKDEFEIIGNSGTIRFPVFGLEILLEHNGVVQKIPFNAPMHNQQNHIEKVVEYFLGKGENPCSANDAIQSMEVMEAFVYGN
jgi:predicted dehydrogenase